jgi:hypothetical protein
MHANKCIPCKKVQNVQNAVNPYHILKGYVLNQLNMNFQLMDVMKKLKQAKKNVVDSHALFADL